MDKELFITILDKFIAFEAFVDTLQSVRIDILETPGFDTTAFMFDRLIEAYFTEEGQDWVNWYMFEKRAAPDEIKATDEDGNDICKDVDDLWEIVKDYLK